MRVVHRIAEVRNALRGSDAVGFVPTMGALHEGHRSLVRRARAECDTVCVSIFVNPAQFGPHEDFDAYPRPLEADLESCREEGADLVFAPSVEEMYPEPPATSVVVRGITEGLEGAHRPGHFDGVALVVTKLFGIVGPCRAYFGEKDAQQLRVIRRLVSDLDLPVEVVGCPTVREPDGLAMSSRNAYLAPGERARARSVSRALFAVRDALESGESDVGRLEEIGRRELDVDDVDYLEVVHPDTLERLGRVDGPALVVAAVRIGRTRLIDNVTAGVRTAPAGVGAGEDGAAR